MIKPITTEKHLKSLVFVIIALMLALQMAAWRGLFADGVNFLLRILYEHDFYDIDDATRRFTYWFTQFPTVVAVKLGVRSLPLLISLFSSWLLFTPILFWGLALWKLRGETLFWAFLGLFSVIYLNLNFFSIGEYNFCCAVSALCLALLLREGKNTRADFTLLMAAALILTLTYAATFFLGVLLAFLALRNLRLAATPRMRLYWTALGTVFVIATCAGLWGFLYPGSPSNRGQALDFDLALGNAPFMASILCVGIAGAQILVASQVMRQFFLLLALAVACVSVPLLPRPMPYVIYSTRVFACLFLFASGALISFFRLGYAHRFFGWRGHKTPFPVSCILPILILFVELACFDMQDSLAYRRYLQDFTAVVNQHSGVLPHAVLAEHTDNDERFGWGWTYPHMSAILRNNRQGAIVLDPDAGMNEVGIYKNMLDLDGYYRAP